MDYLTLFTPLFISWFTIIFALMDTVDTLPMKEPLNDLFPVSEPFRSRVLRSVNSPGRMRNSKIERKNGNKLILKKRESKDESVGPTIPSGGISYCEKLGYQCGDLTALEQIVCLILCANVDNPLMKMYASFMPYIPQYLCLTVNTLFATLPKTLSESKRKSMTVKKLLTMFKVENEDLPEFAKTAANSLIVSLIKRGNGEDIDPLKVVLRTLELYEGSDMDARSMGGSILSFITEFGTGGKFVNQNCDSANKQGEAVILSEIMKKRNCLLDILMPGYYVFARAHSVAHTRRIHPLLKGFTTLLYTLTGVQCCLIPYKSNGTVWKCNFESPPMQSSSDNNNPKTVCGSIPYYELPAVPPPMEPTKEPMPEPDSDEKDTPCGDEDDPDDLYSNEDVDPCEPPSQTNATDYSNEEMVSSDEVGPTSTSIAARSDVGDARGGGGEAGNDNGKADVDAAYGEDAPADNEFYVKEDEYTRN